MKDKKALVFLALVAFVYLLKMAPTGGWMMTDFRSFYFAGIGFFEEGNIYDVRYLTDLAAGSGFQGRIFPYLYPPPLAFYMAPLCQLGARQATTLWVLLSVVLGVLIAVISARLSCTLRDRQVPEKNHILPLLSLLLLVVLPFDNNLKMGQVNIAVLAFIAVAVVQSLVYKRHLFAGLLLAPAIMTKVTPLGLLLFFAMNRRYRTLCGCVVGCVAFAAPTVVSSGGLKTWKHFLDVTGAMGYGKTVPGLFSPASLSNFSVAGCAARFAPNEQVVGLATLTVLAVLGFALLFQHYRLRQKGVGEFLLLPYLVLMIVGSPLTYLHHVIYIYPGLLLCSWIALIRGGRLGWVLFISLIGLTGVASIDFPLLYDQLGLHSTVFRSLNLYALLGLFVLGLIAPDLCKLTKEQLRSGSSDHSLESST